MLVKNRIWSDKTTLETNSEAFVQLTSLRTRGVEYVFIIGKITLSGWRRGVAVSMLRRVACVGGIFGSSRVRTEQALFKSMNEEYELVSTVLYLGFMMCKLKNAKKEVGCTASSLAWSK